MVLTANLLWRVWKARNDGQFNEVERDPFIPINKALREWREYQETTKNQEGEGNEWIKDKIEFRKWELPEKGNIKINTAAIFNKKLSKTEWGIVGRDDKERLIPTWAVPRTCSQNGNMEETLAIRKAIKIVTLEGWKRVEFESNCKETVDKIAFANQGFNLHVDDKMSFPYLTIYVLLLNCCRILNN
ncbi:uncharacterized protein [Coffea arabica]|uniref:RNase H type-1 domain-containing protein n=1 Tax=Coffea arabica TaxID=13443 RepID=A0ABM4W780_COFAR